MSLGRGRGRGRGRVVVDSDGVSGRAKPIAFVSSGRTVQAGVQSKPVAFSSSGQQVASGVGEDQARLSKFADLVGAEAEVDQSPARKRAKTAKSGKEPDLEPFKKYGNGFALKFMKKFDFKGRLGKDETGISAPIAVKARPERLGLGGGGFKEATTLPENRKIHAEQFGETEEEKRKRERKEQEEKEEKELRELWKKAKAGNKMQAKKKQQYKTAAEIAKEKPKEYVVIDMRGKAFDKGGNDDSSSSSSSGSSSDEEEETAALGEEIVYNVEKVRSSLESNVRQISLQVQKSERSLRHEDQQIGDLKEKISQEGEIVVSLREAQDFLCVLIENNADVDYLEKFWPEKKLCLRVAFGEEDKIALQVAKGFFDRCLIDEKSITGVLENGKRWSKFLVETVGLGRSTVDEFFMESMLPRIEKLILDGWDGVTEKMERKNFDNFCLNVLDHLSEFTSTKLVEECAVRVIMPELERRVERWKVDLDGWGRRLDLWITPWVGHLRKHIRTRLHREIRVKLVRTLERRCKSTDDLVTWGVELVKPWKSIFSVNSFDRLCSEGLVNVFASKLRKLEITNSIEKQDFILVRAAMGLLSFVKASMVCSLFEGEFFPRWINVLMELPEKELVRWYGGWKSELSRLVRLNNTHINAYFGRALGIIGSRTRVMEPRRLLFAEEDVKKAPALLGFINIDRAKQLSEMRKKPSVSKPSVSRRNPDEVHAREVLGVVAAKLGTTFQRERRGRISSSGKPIFSLGCLFIIFEGETCYVASDTNHIEHTRWFPTALEEIVKRCK
eukprot:CAMPEP_0203760764 /NCGR_PEP_ID=MMETSP0098-20131031/13989_1 /ASSEMBLY_ACC=CAM_ASM_000208 /TAXON_ID=96639 /ORGANISM=" , Strain NY0313808BC1" /LENGTH=785 /DNA_ID=CAMNT_0050654467 /DNA_START=154 /DNA_END=2511 /DNA_ORIENTATION=+